MNRLILILGLLFLISCKSQKTNNGIEGVWVFDGKTNLLGVDKALKFYEQQVPFIYDFNEDGKLTLKTYGRKDVVYDWSLKSDSILMFDDLEQRIHISNQDNMSIVGYSEVDTLWINLRRPKAIKINYSKAEIEDILLSNIWSIEDTTEQEWQTHFEYFDNKTMIYRYEMFDRNFNDSMHNLQLETWRIDKIEDYFFLYSHHDFLLRNGNLDRTYQIIDINLTSYTVLDIENDNEKTTFHAKDVNNDNQQNLSDIKGNWKAYNSKEKTYGRNISDIGFKTGRKALYEGDLSLSIGEEILFFKIDAVKPLERNWQLSKDGKTLIFEEHIDDMDMDIKGIHVEYADILELTDTKMKIRMFNNYYYTDMEKPNIYLLNLIQEFEKVE